MKKLKLNRAMIAGTELLLFIMSIFAAFWTWDKTTILWNDRIEHGLRDNYDGMCWQHQGLTVLIVLFMIYMLVLVIWEIVAMTDDDIKAPWQRIIEDRLDIETGYYDSGRASNRHRRSDRDHYQSPRSNSDDEDTDESETENNKKMKKKFTLKRAIWIIVLIIVVIYGIKLIGTTYKQSKAVYNTSKIYHNNYQQKVEEKQGYYDKLWKTFYEKKRIANLNKDVFRDITIIIMENRRDGENVTWKWMQENQHIPYGEYTKFYSELSAFIHSQREGYFAIEKQCQQIARAHNTLVDTFPNNLYNRFLKQERIVFEYGMLSDNTLTVFETGTENVSMDEGNTEVVQYESGRKPSTGTPPANQNEMTDAAMLKLIKDQKINK